MPVSDPIEGFFIVSEEGLIFEVKGNVQPKDRIVAYLRYVPDKKGDRLSSDGIRYRKIYGLAEREKFLSRYYSKYLWSSKTHGRVLQAVPTDSIAYVVSPLDGMRQIRDMGYHVSQAQAAIRELAGVLVEESGISWSDIGITGSHLVGMQTKTSDIDLVVYGDTASRKLHSRLCSENSISSIVRYEGKQLESHTKFRWANLTEWMIELKQIESKKCFQGLYSSYDFYIRAVKLPSEMDWSFCDLQFEDVGDWVIEGKVLSDSDSIFTPCIYCIDCMKFPDLEYLVSYRGRFAEHVKRNMRIKARGKLELVTNNLTKRKYMQLVLGEKPSDFLLPQ